MTSFITFLIGLLSGFVFHVVAMKISFKQRTIENKIKVYDSVITIWVKMRNQIYSSIIPEIPQQNWLDLDKLYGESQAYIGEIFLVSEDEQLAKDINTFNEKFYRQNWHKLTLDVANEQIELLKIEALQIIPRMRKDVKESTVLSGGDFIHIIKRLIKF